LGIEPNYVPFSLFFSLASVGLHSEILMGGHFVPLRQLQVRAGFSFSFIGAGAVSFVLYDFMMNAIFGMQL